MQESLRYRDIHFDIHAIGQLTSMVGELGIEGVGRRCWSGLYFTRCLTLIYGFGPDDAPAVGEAARRRARKGLKMPEGFDAAKVLQARV